MKKAFILLLAFLPLFLSAQQVKNEQSAHPRNVIFIVGDGMGTAQVYTSIIAQKGDNSAFLRFPYSGFSRTYSNNKYTTDSGAGGTALMTGHKVDNYHVAKGPDGTDYPSFLITAKHLFGKAAGFVVTSSVLDATPASTYAHVTYRKLYDSISMQMALCPFEVMIGNDAYSFQTANRKDGKAPIDTLMARGYEMAYTIQDLMRVKGHKICALLSGKDAPDATKRGRMLTLGTLKAIEALNFYDNGFTLMVEGSQIDWACHNNDSAYLAAEMADFEDMLHAVLDFAERDGKTLVIVTADHETGGLTLKNGNVQQGVSNPSWSTGGHTGVMVPVFAYGPGAEQFTGIMQNTDFYNKILNLLK